MIYENMTFVLKKKSLLCTLTFKLWTFRTAETEWAMLVISILFVKIKHFYFCILKFDGMVISLGFSSSKSKLVKSI